MQPSAAGALLQDLWSRVYIGGTKPAQTTVIGVWNARVANG